MTRLFFCLLVAGISLPAVEAVAVAEDAKEEAILEDRKQIEGKWSIVSLVVDGNEVPDSEARKHTVINKADGTWSLRKEGEVISKGTSSIDPTKTPKTLDFTVTEGEGKGNQYLGIYALHKKTRKMCFALPAQERPSELTSMPGSKLVCVKFERQKTDSKSAR